jgi:hypothetical protein
MRRVVGAALLAVAAGAVYADVQDEEITVGDQLIQIEVIDPIEILWVGPNRYERVQVLSGPDIEIAAVLGDDLALQLLGVRALVAEQPGTQSCENLGDPREYYVVTLGDAPATHGPLTTCVELTVSATPGAIVLEEEPMGAGEFWSWAPGQGFGTAAN